MHNLGDVIYKDTENIFNSLSISLVKIVTQASFKQSFNFFGSEIANCCSFIQFRSLYLKCLYASK